MKKSFVVILGDREGRYRRAVGIHTEETTVADYVSKFVESSQQILQVIELNPGELTDRIFIGTRGTIVPIVQEKETDKTRYRLEM